MVVTMITNCKGGPMRNKKSKRKKTKASKIEEIEKEYK